MAAYIETRIAELEVALPVAETLAEAHRGIELILRALEDIKQYTQEHPFGETSEEIHYFKVLAPPVYGRLFYFMKLAEIGIEGLHANQDRMESLMNLELAKIDQFFTKHREFCQYLHLNRTFMDDRIFIRDARENEMLDCVEVVMADDFCVGCYWAALLWANQRLRVYFTDGLRKLGQPEAGLEAGQLPVLEWTDTRNDLAELLYGLFVRGSFNHGKATLKEIVAWAEGHLKIDLGNFHNKIQEIARRKKGIVKFLDDVRERVLHRLSEMV